MRWHVVERLSPRQAFTPDGYLIVTDTIIARCGDQIYHHNEVPLDPGDDGTITVSRDASEVFRPEAIASFEGKPITDDHPDEEVTPLNHRELAIGHVHNVRRGTGMDSDCLVADLVFTDPDAIEKVRGRRKLALSCGYDAFYEDMGRGRGAQRKIVGNHVALVDEGRCGARCTIGDSGAAIFSYLASRKLPELTGDYRRLPEVAHDAGCGCDACDHPAKPAKPANRPAKPAKGRKWLNLWVDGVIVWRRRIGAKARDFDPNEKRDEGGEWTAGGGGGATKAPPNPKTATFGEIDLGSTVATVNPNRNDMARMLEHSTNKELRGLFEGTRFIAWPAEEALHQEIQRAVDMSDQVHRYEISARAGRPDAARPYQIGRYAAQIRRDGNVVEKAYIPKAMKLAFGVRDAFDPSEPRKGAGEGGGQWTSGGGGGGTGTGRAEAKRPKSAIFVSPSVAEHLDFPEAVAGLASNRQRILRRASDEIDAAMGLKTTSQPAVGAWSDGAENSIMTTVEGGTFDQLKVAAAMKAHIAEQKAALVFQQQPEGKAILYSFAAKGNLSEIHNNLLADGVEFHTVIPSEGGATIYVVDTEGTAHDAVIHAAERYGTKPDFQTGQAAFIPDDTKSDGSDAEQRAYSQQGYERIIAGSGTQGSAALWQRIHHAYGSALHAVADAFDPNEPRDETGEWTAGGGSSGGKASKPSETFKKGEAITTTPLNGKAFESWHDAPKTNDDWDILAASGKAFDEPPVPALKPGKHQGAGVIIREPDGRVWIVHPTNEYGGYKATFPKGTVEDGMSLKGTALKEAFEESGLGVRLTGYAGDIERDTSMARYYYAERVAGTPADAGWESQAVTLSPVFELKNHLNKKVDHDIVDMFFGGKVKAAVSKSAETPASMQTPGAPVDISKWKKTSGNKGSNPGGQYTDEKGVLHYVKLQKSNDHAKNEFLAARLFEAAGSPVLDTQLVDLGGGKLGTHTVWQDKTNIDLNNPDHLKQAQENFATNAWLANWDAIGMGQHEDDWNQAVVGGKMTTVDPGGSMIFRAQGGPKGAAWGDSVGEWDTMRHGNNPQANKAYGGMTNKQLRDSVLKVIKVPDKTIRELVGKHGPGDVADRLELANRLIARKRDLMKRAMTTDALRRLAA